MKPNNRKQRLFEIMERVAPNFSQNTYQKILNDFPGHAKYTNPVDSLQYKWYEEVMEFMTGNNPIEQKSELVKFFQNHFLGVDYGEFNTPKEQVDWWLAPEQQEFIKGELNATPEKELDETGEWSNDEDDIAWMNSLRNEVDEISAGTQGRLKLIDVRGFDKYQGPYAIVEIQGKNYKIWTMEAEGQLWIEDYPIDNTSGEGKRAGFQGTAFDIIEMLNNVPVSSKDFSYNLNEKDIVEPVDNRKYMDKTTIENIKSTINNAKNNIEDIFEKLPIVSEISKDDAKKLRDAITVLYDLEFKYRYL
jgi:hypothetical protein